MLDRAISSLTELLVVPWPQGISPLVYIENNEEENDSSNMVDDISNEDDSDNYYQNVPVKRLKVYRRFPWKRQNPR